MAKRPPPDPPLNEPEWLFPLHALAVGEGFFVPTMRPAYMLYVIESAAKKDSIPMKVYITQKDGALGVRAWRVG